MKKIHRYYLSPRRTILMCDVYIGDETYPTFCFERNLVTYEVVSRCLKNHSDFTTLDLELHAFMRVSHQYIVNKDALDIKVEDMFELDNPNI